MLQCWDFFFISCGTETVGILLRELNEIPYITVINIVQLGLNDKNQEFLTFHFCLSWNFLSWNKKKISDVIV